MRRQRLLRKRFQMFEIIDDVFSIKFQPMYLFYTSTRWMFGPTLGVDKKVEYGSEVGQAKCPGDQQMAGKWMRKTKFLHRWEKSTALNLACA